MSSQYLYTITLSSNYLKNLKLFSIRVEELFEHTVLRKKGNRFLLFLKAFSWETNFWVTLSDFTVKKQNKNKTKQNKTKTAKFKSGICI